MEENTKKERTEMADRDTRQRRKNRRRTGWRGENRGRDYLVASV